MKEFKSIKEVLGLVLIAVLVFTYLFVGLIRMGGFNEERKRYINNRSVARNFIKRMNDEDLPEFKTLIKNRIEHGKE